jgi:nucleoside-diphosphate-sugar epimerase
MLPEAIRNEDELVDVMTRPRLALVEFVRSLTSPLVILGAGGKMGPTLAVLARRAADAAGHPLEVVAVSRYSDPRARAFLETRGVRTLSADLMDRAAFAGLPDTGNLLYLVGLKFGTRSDPSRTWATNTLVPAYAAERFSQARIVALSTGNVYPLVPVDGAGSAEDDPLTPLGEYSNACVARERVFEYFSSKYATPVVLLRLSFALDLRYGVLVDIASKVWLEEPVSVGMSHWNGIWQGDANEMVIRALALAAVPATAINLVGGQHFSVRETARRFGELMGKPVRFSGTDGQTAFLSNNARLRATLGEPPTSVETVMQWVAGWVMSGGAQLNKPTHFEVRDGGY